MEDTATPGVASAFTPFKGGVGATPIMNAKVTPGRHRVRWEWADGASSELVVELEAGEVKTLKGSSPQASPPSP